MSDGSKPDIAKGRELSAAATQGPWIQRELVSGLIRIERPGDPDALLYRDPLAEPEDTGDIRLTVADAELLVWARNNIDSILDELEDGRGLREQAATQLTNILQQVGEVAQATQKFDAALGEFDRLCAATESVQRDLGSTNPVVPISAVREVFKDVTK